MLFAACSQFAATAAIAERPRQPSPTSCTKSPPAAAMVGNDPRTFSRSCCSEKQHDTGWTYSDEISWTILLPGPNTFRRLHFEKKSRSWTKTPTQTRKPLVIQPGAGGRSKKKIFRQSVVVRDNITPQAMDTAMAIGNHVDLRNTRLGLTTSTGT